MLVQNKLVKYLFFSLGSIAWLLGILGIFLPILPTTPFLLLATFCYARSSEKFYRLLIENKIFGHYITQWREDRSIPLRAKILAIFLIVLSIGTSIIFLMQVFVIKILLALVGATVIIFLSCMKTRNAPLAT